VENKKKDQVTARTTAVGPPCCHRWSGEVAALPSLKWGGRGAATTHSSCRRSPPRSSLDPRRRCRQRGWKEVSHRSASVRSVPPGRKEAAVAVAQSRVTIAQGADGTLGSGTRSAMGGGTGGRRNPRRRCPVDGAGARSSVRWCRGSKRHPAV
jgi:hypothetical protein